MLRRSAALVTVSFLLAISPALPSLAADKFPKNCTPPYNGTAKHRDIDKTCGVEGSSPDGLTDAHKAQNRAKNNLCASGTPKKITFADLSELQQDVDNDTSIHYGSSENLPDRTKLVNLSTSDGTFSEGDVVVLEALVRAAKKGSKESCDCEKTKVLDTDIHVHLTETDGADLCKSIVAEMIPHYRPDEWKWTNFRDMEHFPVRVTGQLFFDGSHKPCSGGAALSGHPARATVWEIHPVYKFEVCEYDECDVPGVWATVATWVKDYK